MFNRILKLNMKSLSNEITGLNSCMEKQLKKNEELTIKLDAVIANQELLFMLIKKLADCFQLEWINGKYVSKRKQHKH